jgi:hypothetical protein
MPLGRMVRHDDQERRGTVAFDEGKERHPALAAQVQVEDDDLRGYGAERLGGLRRAFRFDDNRDAGDLRQHRAEARANGGRVVHEEHLHRGKSTLGMRAPTSDEHAPAVGRFFEGGRRPSYSTSPFLKAYRVSSAFVAISIFFKMRVLCVLTVLTLSASR